MYSTIYCDYCSKPIVGSNGYLIWFTRELKGHSGAVPGSLKIIHHDPNNADGCFAKTERCYKQFGESSIPFDWLKTESEILKIILPNIESKWITQKDGLSAIKRLCIAGYEEAREQLSETYSKWGELL